MGLRLPQSATPLLACLGGLLEGARRGCSSRREGLPSSGLRPGIRSVLARSGWWPGLWFRPGDPPCPEEVGPCSSKAGVRKPGLHKRAQPSSLKLHLVTFPWGRPGFRAPACPRSRCSWTQAVGGGLVLAPGKLRPVGRRRVQGGQARGTLWGAGSWGPCPLRCRCRGNWGPGGETRGAAKPAPCP